MEKPTIRTPSDIINFPKYLESIDPKTRPLRRIITGYYLNEEYPCGLKSCHQPHKEGFLVELEDTYVTNVGWKCGEQFGEKFAIEHRRYTDLELRPRAITTIQDIVSKINGLPQEIQRLADEAARLSQCKQSMRSQFPRLYKDLERRAYSGNNRVTEQIELTPNEIDDLQAMTPGSSRGQFRYRDELRGVLPGLRVLATSIREEVISRFKSKADTIIGINIVALPTVELLEWQSWANHFDEMFAGAENLIADGNQFFTPECFALLKHISIDSAEKASVSKLTVAKLLIDGTNTDSHKEASVEPVALSKKQREIQKRLAAILRKK
jgi:hypothetical protein